jgi:hypothetical protein
VPHTDSGFMTLLPPNRVPGLSINLPNGRWIEEPGIDGAYVVNGGDILHRWTNERFLSTPHRVSNVSGQVRFAIPFFCDPDYDDNPTTGAVHLTGIIAAQGALPVRLGRGDGGSAAADRRRPRYPRRGQRHPAW